MSGLPWLGVRCVAVLEWPAGGGACGEDEVRPVHAPPGCAVDQDRFGLGPGLGVHQHHAALTGGQARVAPCGQGDEYGPQGTAEFCQQVLVAGRVCLVLAPFEQAGADHPLEPAGQQAGGDAEVLLELVEARVAVEGVVQDEQGPPLADQAERRRQRAFPVLEPDLLGHAQHLPNVTAIFEATHFYFSSHTGLKGGGVVMSQAAAGATGSLPPVISEYLAASDRGDAEAVAGCFAEDAVVVDEGRQWRGTAAIRRWRATVATAYQYTVQVTGAEALGEADGAERHDVHVHLEGNFPGGQVDLTDRFALRDGRIASLEIVPAEKAR